MFILLGRFMAPCHCPPAIFGKVRTVSFWRLSQFCVKKKNCDTKKKKPAYKTKYETEDIWILFLSKSKFITKLNFSTKAVSMSNVTVSR